MKNGLKYCFCIKNGLTRAIFQGQFFRILLKHWLRKMFLKCDVTLWRKVVSTLYGRDFLYRHEKLSGRVWTLVHTAPKSGTGTARSARRSFDPSQNPRVNRRTNWYRPVYCSVDITELKQRQFWATHVNRKWNIFPFYMSWVYKICIPKRLSPYRGDLPENLVKSRHKIAKITSGWRVSLKNFVA